MAPDFKFTVCVAVYNVNKYLRECLQSLLAQNFKDVEFIVVDDGSTDGSSEICDEFGALDDRFKIVHHKQNKGSLAARKTAMMHASGEFVSFLDGDDLYTTSSSVEKMYTAISKKKADILRFESTCFGSDIKAVKSQNKWCSFKEYESVNPREVLADIYINGLLSWNVPFYVVRNSIIKKIVQECPDEHLICAEDGYLLFLCLYYAKSFVAVHTGPLYSYRLGCGVSTGKNTLKGMENQAKANRVIRWLGDFLKRNNSDQIYFSCIQSFLVRLLEFSLNRLDDLADDEIKDGFDLLVREGFETDLLCAMYKKYSTYRQIGRCARLIYGAGCISGNNASQNKTIAIFVDKKLDYCHEMAISEQIENLGSLGYRLVLIADEDSNNAFLQSASVTVVSIPNGIENGRLKALNEVLSRNQVDLLIYQKQFSSSILWDLLTIKLRHIRCFAVNYAPVCLNQIKDFSIQNFEFDNANPYIYRLVDKLLVLNSVSKVYYESFGCNAYVFPTLCQFEQLKADVVPFTKRKGILFLGSSWNDKNRCIELLSFMKDLIFQYENNLQCYLECVDEDKSTLDFVKDFIRTNSLDNNIHLENESVNVLKLESCVCVILLTDLNGSSLLQLQYAKQCATPVIAYKATGLDLMQIYGNERNIQIPPNNSIATKDVVLKYLNDDGDCEQCIHHSRPSAEHLYQALNPTEQWLALLNHCQASDDFHSSSFNMKIDELRILGSILEQNRDYVSQGLNQINRNFDKYHLLTLLMYAVKGRLSLSRRNRHYYRDKLKHIFLN